MGAGRIKRVGEPQIAFLLSHPAYSKEEADGAHPGFLHLTGTGVAKVLSSPDQVHDPVGLVPGRHRLRRSARRCGSKTDSDQENSRQNGRDPPRRVPHALPHGLSLSSLP